MKGKGDMTLPLFVLNGFSIVNILLNSIMKQLIFLCLHSVFSQLQFSYAMWHVNMCDKIHLIRKSFVTRLAIEFNTFYLVHFSVSRKIVFIINCFIILRTLITETLCMMSFRWYFKFSLPSNFSSHILHSNWLAWLDSVKWTISVWHCISCSFTNNSWQFVHM